jgi:Family of unknown function (DUF5317)
MVFIDVVLVALVVGRLLGGRLAALGTLDIKGVWLAFLAMSLQVVAFPVAGLPWHTPDTAARVLWLISYALLITLLAWNIRLRGAPVIAAGLLCNLAAIIANGGLMPVRASALAAIGRAYARHQNSVELARPHLGALIDRWGVPHWLPLGNVYSIGDVLIALGTAVVVILAMRNVAPPEAETPRSVAQTATA